MIRELTMTEFEQFVLNSPLASYYQTREYGLLMGEYGYDYELIGYVNEYNQVKAASLILIKKTAKFKYGYAPRGFILDYFNKKLVHEFTTALISYYKKKKVCFIKLNPNIAISEVDPSTNLKTYNWNFDILNILEENHYLKLKDNLYFESVLPRFNPIVSFHNFELKNLEKNTRNKIRKGQLKGLHMEKAQKSGIDILNRFVLKKKNIGDFYYKDYYAMFEKEDYMDLFLVSIDSEEFLLNSRNLYEKELEQNAELNQHLKKESKKIYINKKMSSDRNLLAYKNDIALATDLNKKKDKIYIAGALVIRFQNRIHIVISGYDTKFKHFDPNYFLHYSILEYYKNDFDYADLNGITGDFSLENPYYGLNQFKLGFKPKIYEYIGEFDLPIQPRKYLKLRKNGTLARTFHKKDIKPVPKKKKEIE
ncbi:MAG: peptidoglycan bridge formation glycyltransferase FemA/FemB family protein [Bacilli bacterium]|nr:peptidoglycan bridge formation glycyltransferase FemA/FemB family protein [Bacilli bacterium]